MLDRQQQLETIAAVHARLAGAFAAAGIDSAAGDARRLIAAATGVSLAAQIGNPTRALTAREAHDLDAMAIRRQAREPVSRILGWREFYGRPFLITPAVLDPRPDTETLIDAALHIGTREGWDGGPRSILDLGTGSGAILLTLLAHWPRAFGVGLDISADALACASANANALGLGRRCRFERADMAHANLEGFDLVVANPPYIRTADMAALEPEVTGFDPHLALAGGADGLTYDRIILDRLAAAGGVAKKPHWLLLELGAGQYQQVFEIIEEKYTSFGAPVLLSFTDLAGHIRCIAIKPHPGGQRTKELGKPLISR